MAKTIEINTDTLSRNIENLEGQTTALDAQSKKMFDALGELNAMWAGPANQEFSKQFTNDMNTCNDMIKILRELIDRLKTARKEYDSCEQRVNSLINGIRI